MKTLAIVSEYNPFHSGHQYQIKQVRQKSKVKLGILAIMSGYFCQRGEPAIISPRQRAEQAVKNGVNLVLQLPAYWSTATAETYASAAVQAMACLNYLDYQAFGYESTSPDKLQAAATYLNQAPNDFSVLCNQLLTGDYPDPDKQLIGNYAAARAKALSMLRPDLAETLSQPNQILAVEYLRAGQTINNTPKPIMLARQGSGYLDNNLSSDRYSSASAIRAYLRNHPGTDLTSIRKLKQAMPASSLAILLASISQNRPVDWQLFADLVYGLLDRFSVDELAHFRYFDPQLASRLKKLCQQAYQEARTSPNLLDLIQQTASRPFPISRVQRALTSLLLNIENDSKQLELGNCQQGYLQVLAFDRDGKYMLKQLQKRSDIKLVSNFSELTGDPDPFRQKLAYHDRLAASLWTRATGINPLEILGPPLFYKN